MFWSVTIDVIANKSQSKLQNIFYNFIPLPFVH